MLCFWKIGLGQLLSLGSVFIMLWGVLHVPSGFLTTHVSVFQASDYLSSEDLLRSEVEESQRKLQVAMDTLNFFKQEFQDRREHLHTYFKENQNIRLWDFQSSLVFVRLDSFLTRLHVVEVSALITLGFQLQTATQGSR